MFTKIQRFYLVYLPALRLGIFLPLGGYFVRALLGFVSSFARYLILAYGPMEESFQRITIPELIIHSMGRFWVLSGIFVIMPLDGLPSSGQFGGFTDHFRKWDR